MHNIGKTRQSMTKIGHSDSGRQQIHFFFNCEFGGVPPHHEIGGPSGRVYSLMNIIEHHAPGFVCMVISVATKTGPKLSSNC